MVRYTLRAEAAHRASPCEVLQLLNAAILRQFGDGRFCTVLHGRVTVGDGGVRLALAAPVIRRRSCCAPAGRRARAGGGTVARGPTRRVPPDVTVTLDAGDALLCFTDGVTQVAGPPGMFGDDRLAEVLAGSAGLTAGVMVDRMSRPRSSSRAAGLRTIWPCWRCGCPAWSGARR